MKKKMKSEQAILPNPCLEEDDIIKCLLGNDLCPKEPIHNPEVVSVMVKLNLISSGNKLDYLNDSILY
jgi:hypothetical protein